MSELLEREQDLACLEVMLVTASQYLSDLNTGWQSVGKLAEPPGNSELLLHPLALHQTL